MNLKEKSKEAKEYGEIKNRLIQLIDNYLAKYEEYENIYKDIFTQWSDKLIREFEAIFKSEGFNVTTKKSSYQSVYTEYKTINAVSHDLEFELLINVDDYREIRFLQNKPEVDRKNIVIRPTIKRYMISISMTTNKPVSRYENVDLPITSVYHLQEKKEKISKTQYSIEVMETFISNMEKGIALLSDEIKKIESAHVNSIGIPMGKFGREDRELSYGEFGNLSELIERI